MSYILFGLSQVLFPIAFIYSNDKKINPVETSLVRGLVSMLVNFAIIRYYDMSLDYKYNVNFKNLFKRNIILTNENATCSNSWLGDDNGPVLHAFANSPYYKLLCSYFHFYHRLFLKWSKDQ